MTYPDQDVICLMAFSWGHTKRAESSRDLCQQHLAKTGRNVAVGEHLISVNELAMSLQNHNLWLNSTDADWHRPLQVVIRAFTQKNFKFQGQMSEKQRKNQEKHAPSKRSTATTGYKGSEEWEERYTMAPPWKTREDKVWRNYDREDNKKWWESAPSYSASSKFIRHRKSPMETITGRVKPGTVAEEG
jgi:hypothetical protein